MNILTKFSYYLAIAGSIISQVFIVMKIGNANALKMIWLIPLTLLFTKTPQDFISNRLKIYYLFAIIFYIYCLLLESITGIKYVGTDMTNICISFIILFVSYSFTKQYANAKTIQWVSCITITCAFVYGLVIYYFFLKGSNIFSIVYAFKEKNSAAQILLAASIIGMTVFSPKNQIIKYLNWTAILIMTIFIFLMKCRTTILAVIFIITYYTFVYKDKKVRWLFFIAIFAVILYVLCNESVYHTLVDGILLANRDINDVNEMSSNRADYLEICLTMIEEKPFFGNGNYYFDSFPIVMIVQYGIVGALPVFSFIAYLIFWSIKHLNRNDNYELCAFLMLYSYLINCLFEAQPPFGPGAKCFLLWVVWGIMLAKQEKRSNQHYNIIF